MTYHINFGFVWKYADKLYWGLLLSLELAAVSILIGCIIGFVLAVAYNDGGRWVKAGVAGYVEFIRTTSIRHSGEWGPALFVPTPLCRA